MADAGAIVAGERVRIGRDIIEAAIGTAPEEFTFHARNPAATIRIGGDWIAFAPVGGPPNCSDADHGRRPGTFADNANFIRLAQHFNCIHTAGGGSGRCARHSCLGAAPPHRPEQGSALRQGAVHIYSTGRARLFDGIEMARIARGIGPEQLLSRAVRVHDHQHQLAAEARRPMARASSRWRGTARSSCVTPFTLAGAMAPVTMAGALVQQNAEALAGIAFTQMVQPGAPVIYGGFTSNVDMKSGAPAFGTPEYMKAPIVGGQLARRYRLPYRTSNTCAANAVDAQAAYESVFSLWGAIMGGGNLVLHAAGWLEGGLVASYEKIVLDVDSLQMVAEFLEPLDMADDCARASMPSARSVRAGISSAPSTRSSRYADRLLCADDLGLAQFRDTGPRPAAGWPSSKANAHLEAGAGRISRSPRSTRRSARSWTPSSNAASGRAARRRTSRPCARRVELKGPPVA